MEDLDDTQSRSVLTGGLLEAPTLNIANILTALRLALVPVFAVLVTHKPEQLHISAAAFVVFVFATATDYVDGYIARRYGLITNFGKIADPIADKALIGVALIVLSADGIIPWSFTIVILTREVFITGLRFWVIRRGVIPANRGGKWKTASQSTAVILYLAGFLGFSVLTTIADYVMFAALVLTLLTAADYIRQARRLVQDA